MLKRLKNYLGIESVKLQLVANLPIYSNQEAITGSIILSAIEEGQVNALTIQLVEKYERGRDDNKLINEYVLGSIMLDDKIMVPANEPVEVNYSLPFIFVESEMDRLEGKNFFTKRIVKLAKYLRQVKSTYQLVAKADVKGTKLMPVTRLTIQIEDT